jgi:serine/threonine protein kinase
MQLKSLIFIVALFSAILASNAPVTTCSNVVTIFAKGKYSCLQEKKVGSGATAAAFKVTEKSTQTTRLIKVQKIYFPTSKLRAQKEINYLNRLNHPNIIKVIENNDDSNLMATVLEYADRGDLEGIIKSGQSILENYREVLEFMLKLFKAVDYMHSQKVIHADLKTANIVITGDNTPKIIDFDLATDLHNADNPRGTPLYMAPEVMFQTFSTFEPEVDTYSLGVIFYEIIFRKVPFNSDTMEGLRSALKTGSISFKAKTDVMAVYAIVSCLQFDPKKRIPLKQLIAEIEDYLKKEHFSVMSKERKFLNKDSWILSDFLNRFGNTPVTYPSKASQEKPTVVVENTKFQNKPTDHVETKGDGLQRNPDYFPEEKTDGRLGLKPVVGNHNVFAKKTEQPILTRDRPDEGETRDRQHKRDPSLDTRRKGTIDVNQPVTSIPKEEERAFGIPEIRRVASNPNIIQGTQKGVKQELPKATGDLKTGIEVGQGLKIFDGIPKEVREKNKAAIQNAAGNYHVQEQKPLTRYIVRQPFTARTNTDNVTPTLTNRIFGTKKNIPYGMDILGYDPYFLYRKRALSQAVQENKEEEQSVPSDPTRFRRIVLLLIFCFGIVIPTLFFIFWRVSRSTRKTLASQESAVTAKATDAPENVAADQEGTLRMSMTN